MNRNKINFILLQTIRRKFSTTVSNPETETKVGIVKSVTNYSKALYKDYRDVSVDIYHDCKKHPVRTMFLSVLAGSCYYVAQHNPDEISFREEVISASLKLSQVGHAVQNPVSVAHLGYLEQCFNEELIWHLNFGLFSAILLRHCNIHNALYQNICPYTTPRITDYFYRIVDIGFLDRWWILDKYMMDYDINEEEFNSVISEK